MLSLNNRIPPPVVAALAAVGMWGLSMLGPQFNVPSELKYLAVGIFVAIGAAFDLLGLFAFRRARTTINPLKPERASSFVTGSVYRLTRNPMYVGLVMLLLAWAAYLCALWPLIGPVVFVLYITRFQIQPEERILKEIFGQEYETYCTRVRRWL